MNSGIFLPNLWRFVGLVAMQTIILSEASLNTDGYCNVLLYPLFILFLPIKLPVPAVVLLGFWIGLVVDYFTGTLGVNASAGAFSGYIRAIVLHRFAPKGGYTGKEPIPAPAYFGWRWFLSVASIFFAAHLFWYFAMSYFTPSYLVGKILPHTVIGWLLTMPGVFILTRLFYPKY
jgi:hypothetical protein